MPKNPEIETPKMTGLQVLEEIVRAARAGEIELGPVNAVQELPTVTEHSHPKLCNKSYTIRKPMRVSFQFTHTVDSDA